MVLELFNACLMKKNYDEHTSRHNYALTFLANQVSLITRPVIKADKKSSKAL